MITTPSTAVLATRLSRLLARLVDGILAMVPFFFMGGHSFGYESMMMRNPVTYVAMSVFSSVFGIIFLVYIGVQVYLLTTRGQSIGKIALGLRIANVKTGEAKGFVQNVLLREVLNAFLGIVPFYGLIDALLIFRSDKRCIHDHIASTVVVKA